MVWWLRLCTSNAEGKGSIPGWGPKVPHEAKKDLKTNRSGRPMPGKCPRRGANQPHSWVKNREW